MTELVADRRTATAADQPKERAPARGADRAAAKSRRHGADHRHRHHDLPFQPDARGRHARAATPPPVGKARSPREATIQIKPADGLDMEADARTSPAQSPAEARGVLGAKIVDREATARLLEPWLGSGLNIDELPVPRLIVVTIDPRHSRISPRYARQSRDVDIPTASLDDHRTWVDRLGCDGAHDRRRSAYRCWRSFWRRRCCALSLRHVAPWPATATSSRCCISSAPRRALSRASSASIS